MKTLITVLLLCTISVAAFASAQPALDWVDAIGDLVVAQYMVMTEQRETLLDIEQNGGDKALAIIDSHEKRLNDAYIKYGEALEAWLKVAERIGK